MESSVRPKRRYTTEGVAGTHGSNQPLWGAPIRWFVRHTWEPYVDAPYRRITVERLKQLVEGAKEILDVGCGDGAIGAQLMEAHGGLKATGIEIVDSPGALIPTKQYDGKRIPFPDESFDLVMATDVLHHTPDIPAMLKEMARVSKRYVLVKDHTVYGFFSRAWISLIDFATNVPFGIHCEYNYPSLETWRRYMDEVGLAIEREELLDIGPGTRFHPIFLLVKKNACG